MYFDKVASNRTVVNCLHEFYQANRDEQDQPLHVTGSGKSVYSPLSFVR